MESDRFNRQSFLGPTSAHAFRESIIGVIGGGGGGSHAVQQLAHIGFEQMHVFDPDVVEASNLNRLIGATPKDAFEKTLKVDVASRLVTAVNPEAIVIKHDTAWQLSANSLKK